MENACHLLSLCVDLLQLLGNKQRLGSTVYAFALQKSCWNLWLCNHHSFQVELKSPYGSKENQIYMIKENNKRLVFEEKIKLHTRQNADGKGTS